MSNVGNNLGNWRNIEVVHRPNNGKNDYRGSNQNNRQGNQWFESRNRFQNDDRRFNDRGYQFRNRGQNDDFSRGDQRNRGSSENFSRGSRKQMGRLNVLKVNDIKGGSKIILDFDQKSLAIQESQIEDIKVDDGNLHVDLSETKLNVVANVLNNNTIENTSDCINGTEFAVGDIERLFEDARRNTETKHENGRNIIIDGGEDTTRRFDPEKDRERNDSPYIEEQTRSRTRMPDEELINNGKTMYKESLVTGGLGRKRQLQVIRTRVNRPFKLTYTKNGAKEKM
ncbi:hypothetical protein TNCV_2764251 [Trichonephila clavipes]|nr:hypothetical protein TNCV_2764251 [Trichonephila clavipes]